MAERQSQQLAPTKDLRLSDLNPAAHTTFSFYEFFISSGYVITGAPSPQQANALAAGLLALPVQSIAPGQLDAFTALVLTHGKKLAKSSWVSDLAEHCAHGFCELLTSETERPQRMRLTRLSMLLRELQDTDADTQHISESIITSKNPWDSLASGTDPSDYWAISCDHDNVRLMHDQRMVWSQRLGLPTQLDALQNSIWIGSHYSNGGHIVLGHAAEPQAVTVLHVEHSQPLVLAFAHAIQHMALDSMGTLWKLEFDASENKAWLGKKIAQLPIRFVHRARFIEGCLYAFDWARPYSGVCVHLHSLEATSIDTGSVMVCNDVCKVGNALFAVCKLQGQVFKLNTDWKTIETRLGAGSAPGRLYDPIMVRPDGQGHLDVLNWFSGKLTRLAVF